MAEKSNRNDSRWRSLTLIGVLGTAFLVAMATAIGTGLGSEALGLLDDGPELISYSADEEVAECGTELFVGGDRAALLVSGEAPSATDWPSFQRSNRASVSGQSVVEVGIQGQTERTVTLTRIDFAVKRRPRPPGAVFAKPCGESARGRFVQADLDRESLAVINSSADPNAQVGGMDRSGRGAYRPIRFPWTVSVTDPLLLKVVATTKRCYCTWKAEISWRSGDRSGVLPIDNDGKGYTVVGDEGVPTVGWSASSSSGWRWSGR